MDLSYNRKNGSYEKQQRMCQHYDGDEKNAEKLKHEHSWDQTAAAFHRHHDSYEKDG